MGLQEIAQFVLSRFMTKKLIHSLQSKGKRRFQTLWAKESLQYRNISENRNMQLHKSQKNNKAVFFFPEASQQARILNSWIWLANHTLVASSAFCNTNHSPGFFCGVTIMDKSKSSKNICKCPHTKKNMQWAQWKWILLPRWRSLQPNYVIRCKHHILLSCFFFPIWKKEFPKNLTCYLLVLISLCRKNLDLGLVLSSWHLAVLKTFCTISFVYRSPTQ